MIDFNVCMSELFQITFVSSANKVILPLMRGTVIWYILFRRISILCIFQGNRKITARRHIHERFLLVNLEIKATETFLHQLFALGTYLCVGSYNNYEIFFMV